MLALAGACGPDQTGQSDGGSELADSEKSDVADGTGALDTNADDSQVDPSDVDLPSQDALSQDVPSQDISDGPPDTEPTHDSSDTNGGIDVLPTCSPGVAPCTVPGPMACAEGGAAIVQCAEDPESGALCVGTIACQESSDCVLGGCLEGPDGPVCQQIWVGDEESCNGLDDDCNGAIDDVAPNLLDFNVLHCGECGQACTTSEVQWVGVCENGQCGQVPCPPGWTNPDGHPGNGCEFFCTPSGAESCNGADDDCNGMVDDVPEAQVAADPLHCGICFHVCSTQEPAWVGGCARGECTEEACPPNTWDLDGWPGNGCEYACTPSGPEVCNGADDDCDGAIDEGFDLQTDPNHCGACNAACAHPTVAEARCVDGQCYSLFCEGDFIDNNGLFSDGCEKAPGLVIWVDPSNAGDPLADGTAENPFATLAPALAAAPFGALVKLAAGEYAGPLVLNKVGVTVRGSVDSFGEPQSVVVGPAGGASVQLTANQVAVEHLLAKNAAGGLHVRGPQGGQVVGTRALAIQVFDVKAPTNWPGGTAALQLERAPGAQLAFCEAQGVSGGGGNAAEGGPTYGIWLQDAPGALVLGNVVSGVTGGAGKKLSVGSAPSGGVAAGVAVSSSTGATFRGNQLSAVVAGPPGISAAGIAGAEQVPVGLWVAPGSEAIHVSRSNLAEAAPIVWLHGATGAVVSGLHIMGPLAPSSRGAIVVLNSSAVTLEYNKVGAVRGMASRCPTCAPSAGVGIALDGCAGCTVRGNTIDEARGGDGFVGQGPRSEGGAGYGIWLSGGSARLEGNVIGTVRGGAGAAAEAPGGYGTRGGAAAGIAFQGVAANAPCADISCAVGVVVDNQLTASVGGPGGDAPGGTGGQGGSAAGVALMNQSKSQGLANNRTAAVVPGAGGEGAVSGAPGGGFGVYLHESSLANRVELSNQVGGRPIVYLHGASGDVVSNLVLSGPALSTNWGQAAVIASEGVSLESLVIEGGYYEGGCSATAVDPACNAPDAAGVRLWGCSGCAVVSSTIKGITGGHGGAAHMGTPGSGANAYGILVEGSSQDAWVAANTVQLVQAGASGFGASSAFTGSAVGIGALAPAAGTAIEGNDVWNIRVVGPGTPGLAAAYRLPGTTTERFAYNAASWVDLLLQSPGTASLSACALLEGTTGLFVDHLSCHHVGGSGGTNASVAACIFSHGGGALDISHLSCAHVGLGAQSAGYGVYRYASAQPIGVSNSIVAFTKSGCVYNLGPGAAEVAHSSLHSCGSFVAQGASTLGTLATDPQFMDLAAGNLRLKFTSPAVDAADPAADYCSEAAPNGCRADQGATGNTPGSTPKLGAAHCPCD